MNHSPFSATPPDWVQAALHSTQFRCPCCDKNSQEAGAVWINRRAPVYGEGMSRRKWQEFYQCGCGTSWWSWSSDRPLPEWRQDRKTEPEET
jgi:hypothetical protein